MSDSMPTLAELDMAFDGLCSDYTRAEIMERAYLAIKSERDELLAALKAIVECGGGACENAFHATNIEVARAAIADAEKDKL